MPVDYSKWDALELSDDSDIEVHPNVDKRSFIRAKQTQIHQQRIDRKHRIATLKFEHVLNGGLMARIDALLKGLQNHKKDAESKPESTEIDEVIFDVLMEVNSDTSLGPELPESRPAGIHSQEPLPSYSTLMARLVDQVKAEVEKSEPPGIARYRGFIAGIEKQHKEVDMAQKNLLVELAELERQEGSKITSESIHTGFSSSHVSKSQPAPKTTSAVPSKTVSTELLNPRSGSEADIEDSSLDPAPGEDEDEAEASPTAKQFGQIRFGDYAHSLQFIGSHPEILSEKETDGLLVEAFNAQMNAASAASPKKQEGYARQCVHQALLLQYCRQLGKDGVGLFFKRVQTPGHQAQKLFLDDVNTTYARIKSRTAELAKQRDEEGGGDREQIQLHAVDPDTTIHIVSPPPREQCTTEDESAARDIFESFPPNLQKALEAGSLDKVNEVLGKMSVDEAEQVVEQLGTGGMLSLEQGVIDATTDEGKKQMEEIERTHRMPGQPSPVD